MTFDWPWPANYGGIIDVYYRLEALLSRGVRLRVHVVAFEDRVAGMPAHWQEAGVEVFWHPRRCWWSGLSPKPYISSSREVGSLLTGLANGANVILFEGLHSCAYLGHPRLSGKQQWVRVHNREADYYRELADRPAPLAKRLYYREEARRLRGYEDRVLAQADLLLPASPQDEAWCEGLAPGRVFGHRSYTSVQHVESRAGRGDYALFHAALHVEDNVAAALTLMDRFAQLPNLKLVIAGRQAPEVLRKRIQDTPSISLEADPSAERMDELIAAAHVVTLHSAHAAGYKVKLVESLARGRHVLANSAMVTGSGVIATAVHVADDGVSWQAALVKLWETPFDEGEIARRQVLLGPVLPPALSKNFCEILRQRTFTRN